VGRSNKKTNLFFKKILSLLFFLLLLIFPFGQLTNLNIFAAEINIYFHDLFTAVIIFIWAIDLFLNGQKNFLPLLKQKSELFQFAFGFIFVLLFSLGLALSLYQGRELMIGFLYIVRWSAYFLLYPILKSLVYKNRSLKVKFFKTMLLAGVFSAFLGLLQYIFIPDITPLTSFGWDPHYFRVVGTYLDPGYTGMIYVMGLILFSDKLIKDKKEKKWKKKNSTNIILLSGFAVLYMALSLTYSRSSYLAYITAVFLITFYKKRLKIFSFLLGLGVITLLFLPRPGGEGVRLERQSTVFARLNNYKTSLKIAIKKPLFGHGFNLYRYTQKNLGFLNDDFQKTHAGAGADASFLFILAAAGSAGLLVYIYLLKQIIKTKSIIIKASFLSLAVHSFFNNSLFYAWLMIWGWLVLALKENN